MAEPGDFWKFMIGLPVAICSVRVGLLATRYTHDTPKSLVNNDKIEEAMVILEKLYYPDRARKEVSALEA